jgi:hypothetical protein
MITLFALIISIFAVVSAASVETPETKNLKMVYKLYMYIEVDSNCL